VNFKDQWASHHITEDREFHLYNLDVEADILQEPAWVLFTNIKGLQQQLTDKVYSGVELTPEIIKFSNEEFVKKLKTDVSSFTIPEVYNGFYDNRQVSIPDDFNASDNNMPQIRLEELFTEENALLPKKIQAAAGDLEVLKAIRDKRIQTKSFDFDGVKYNQEDSATVIEQLEKEMKAMQAELDNLDDLARKFFIKKASNNGKGEELQKDYTGYFTLRSKADAYLKTLNEMLESLEPIFSGRTIPVEEIRSMIYTLKHEHEPEIKQKLNTWIEERAFSKDPELL
jgi:hypothetical protein